ncbi:spore germination protein [Virgibacillus profundi]|uniref:Spore germination protein n=1 Tax=Virgibacillus profundi TaxID=2024555 RepID=A0A2A2I9U0_9BACI|nr:spore germination protein [Virgibacillus profundi]PAV27823.1 spore germination protein [Virgibacillus profundi]PXY51950.1 spore germination protein [Virgibacillus profundi]
MARRAFSKGRKNQGKQKNNEQSTTTKLESYLAANIQQLKQLLDQPGDLVIREFTVGEANITSAIVYIDGLIDRQLVQDSILGNLQDISVKRQSPEESTELFNEIYQTFISITSIEKGNTLDDVANAIVSGKTVFLLDGQETVLIMDTKGGETRSIEQPISETVVRGPRAAFVENLGTNLSLLRRSIQTPDLRFKTHQIGKRSKRSLVVAYVDGVINPKIVKEVNRRLEMIDIDDAPESGFIEQWIEDSFLSPFPQMNTTERADKAASGLLQGKVVILLDGTPFVLIAPVTLGDILKSPEDYYERWLIGSLLRSLRYFAAFIALFLPALYISLVTIHPGLLPSELALSIAASRQGVPFPPVVEAFLMVITMELLQEAGIRLPTPIGQTIGIVGGLVVGESAVSAGIVSPIMVIVVALTAIAAYANPSFSIGITFRIVRFGFMLAASILGLFGIILVYIMINIHLVNLKSFGIPYSTPFAPTMARDWKDLVIRAPMTMLTKRPKFLEPEDAKSGNKGAKDS